MQSKVPPFVAHKKRIKRTHVLVQPKVLLCMDRSIYVQRQKTTILTLFVRGYRSCCSERQIVQSVFNSKNSHASGCKPRYRIQTAVKQGCCFYYKTKNIFVHSFNTKYEASLRVIAALLIRFFCVFFASESRAQLKYFGDILGTRNNITLATHRVIRFT